MVPQFLNQLGLQYYQQGRYRDALHEFQKTLILEPDNDFAKKYIQLIQYEGLEPASRVLIPGKELYIDEQLEILERQQLYQPELPYSLEAEEDLDQMVERIYKTEFPFEYYGKDRYQHIVDYLDYMEKKLAPAAPPFKKIEPVKKVTEIPVLRLDSSLENVIQPIEIEFRKSIIIQGSNLRRFLLTQPAIVSLKRRSPDEYLVTAQKLGFTYIHLWDDNGRWTINVLGVPEKPEGLLTPEEELIALEKERNFKLRYSLDWSSFEQGESLKSLNRQSYTYSHSLGLTGGTPYGNIDSSASIRSLRETSDLTFFTIGLTEGRWWNFDDFTLRGFDYEPPVENLAFGSTSVRGLMLQSPAFGKKIDYTVFWGREGGGRFGDLSPGLADIESKFLAGTKIVFRPTLRQVYSGSVFKGWGRDREENLHDYAYDFSLGYNFNKWGLSYEIANDTEAYSHLFNYKYRHPGLNFSAELRDIDKDFLTIVGFGSRVGELGGLFKLDYQFNPNFNSSVRLDVFRDRLFPSADNPERWNQDLDLRTSYQIDELTSFSLDYSLLNDLGRVSEFRSHTGWATLNRTFETITKVNSYIAYQYSDVSNFTAPALDYFNHKLIAGLRCKLISDLYYYVNKEMNWTREKTGGGLSKPQAWETGVDWAGEILNNSNFSGNFRVSYRDEEDTQSIFSFLSGEDYLEGYSELNYRPTPNNEAYISGRVRNIWADNPEADNRIEVDFRAGMRYLWDTGVSWRTVGSIEGIVYKDYNSDALRQDDEPPVEGVRLYVGEKSTITDILGYYKFDKVKAKNIRVRVDTTTLPTGYVLTVPAVQSVAVSHGRTDQIDFGITAKSEISGIVFVDKDLNGKFSKGDTGLRDVTLSLEDNSTVTTDASGRYFFRNVSPGKHTITLDINSVPVKYLPEVAISKELELYEGMTFKYNIPLKEIEE